MKILHLTDVLQYLDPKDLRKILIRSTRTEKTEFLLRLRLGEGRLPVDQKSQKRRRGENPQIQAMEEIRLLRRGDPTSDRDPDGRARCRGRGNLLAMMAHRDVTILGREGRTLERSRPKGLPLRPRHSTVGKTPQEKTAARDRRQRAGRRPRARRNQRKRKKTLPQATRTALPTVRAPLTKKRHPTVRVLPTRTALRLQEVPLLLGVMQEEILPRRWKRATFFPTGSHRGDRGLLL